MIDAVRTLTVAAVDALLPQTQCTRCGYPDCAAYARAIVDDEAPVNRCPPGGEATLMSLAALTGREPLPLDPACGAPAALDVAVVDESRCIGCTICIRACPVDAILGAPKRMHAVLEALCSGCELCIAPCPVDCIAMVPSSRMWSPADAKAARLRHVARDARLARGERIAERRSAAHRDDARMRRAAAIADAIERAKARRAKNAGVP